MRITLIGPGRAGMAIALAARAAGHQIVAVMARRLEAAGEAAEQLDSPEALPLDGVVPSCDLALLAVRDDCDWDDCVPDRQGLARSRWCCAFVGACSHLSARCGCRIRACRGQLPSAAEPANAGSWIAESPRSLDCRDDR